MLQELAQRVEHERKTQSGRFTLGLKQAIVSAANDLGRARVTEALGLGAATIWAWQQKGILGTPSVELQHTEELPDCSASGVPMTFRINYNDEEPSEEQQPDAEPSTVIEIITKKGTSIKIYE